MKSKNYLLSVVLFFLCYCSMFAQVPVPFTQRIPGGTKIQGDIVFLGNHITNTAPANNPAAANLPYNGTSNNNGLNFEYIDIDGDPTTFSSSSADLNINSSCKKIIYAGLYWTATYPFARSGPGGDGTSSNYNGSPRSNTWNQVKLKVPGGAYVNISADAAADPVGQEDDIIFDGYNAANPNSSFYGAPYVCYKNVTGLLQALANANGTYTIADQRAATGIRPDGISSGWSIVVIYQDPNLPSKYISMFDGYANIDAGINASVDFNINGFLTVPAPQPVRGRIGISTLEGDYNITGDNLRIKANSVVPFTTITNGLNPNNNFFNGSVTMNNIASNNRNPASSNTLGFDLDIVGVNNPLNAVIPNGETGATLRATTNGDSYGVYLTTFDVEIIEPKIVLTKVVQDATGADIGNGNVNLCQDLNYVIGYQNIGNDDATSFTIKDVLPINITFNPATDLVLPPGVTYTYNAGTRTLIFTIPNNQVNIGDPRQEIRIKVKVVCTCIDLDDACSNVIKNQAFASYSGNINNTFVLTDDPSLSTFSACNLSSPSSTNFLVGLDDCDFTRDVVLCGNSVTLTAANGYTNYEWHGPAPSNAIIGTTQTITVSQLGTYTVNDNINTSPCKSIVETIHVIDFTGAAALTNPVIPYADQVVICPNDNKPLPLIFLCGAGDSQLIQTNIAGATSIVWQQLNTGSCAAVVNPNCANVNPGCTWTNVGVGPNYTANAAGQYKVIINFPNGCFREFYFNVFQNLLAPTYTSTDVICNTQGSITVNNVPAGYEYMISSNPGVWGTNNVFSPLAAGVYTISIRQIGVVGGCVFTLPNIPIRAHNFSVTTILTQPICPGDKGSINIAALDVNPQYTYSIYQEPGHILVSNAGPMNASNYIFSNLNPGNYSYQVITQDGCNGTGLFTINAPPLLSVTAAITKPLSCTDGEITVYPVGGTAPYNYIITGAVNVIQSSPIITAPVAGTYNIQIVDFNNCTASTSITVVATLAPVFNVTHTDLSCSNSGNTGSISINVTNPNGNTLMYSINGVAGPFSNSSVFNNLAPGTYNVVVQYSIGSSVCTTAPQTVTITAPTAIIGISTLTTPYTCTSNGVITVSGVSGGTPGYTYSIGGPFQAGTTFPITGPGTYIVTIKDTKGCTFATAPIVVDPLNPPTDLSFVATALTCPSNTSNVTLTATGGDPVLNYQILLPAVSATPYQVSNVFNNLLPNTYTFQVKDGKNCTYQESFTINPLAPLTVTGTLVSNVKCFGSSTGSVSFTVSGSTGFTYTINGGASTAGASPVVLTNLPAGPYTIVVTNTATNCTATATVTVNGPAAALAAPVTTNPITCLIPGGGQATVNATGGWGGYTYSMAPMPGGVTQSGNVFSNIPAGSYVITTTDSGGCAVTTNFTLTAPVAPTATISPLSDFCYDGINGATIIINAAGGVGPYRYKVNAGGYQVSNTFGPLVPGSYTFTVIDSYGCTFTLPVQTITPQITLNTVLTKPLDCTASPSAVITGTIGAGTGYSPYTYQVNYNLGGFLPVPGNPVVGSTFTYTAAAPGTYQFMVTDAHGCTATSGVITIAPLVPVAATHVKTDNKCFGDASGTVTITPSGGVGPYQVQFGILPFSSTFTYTNLAAGTYNYVVKDSRSCTFNGSVTITQPTQIAYTAVVNPITCNPAGGPYIKGSICITGVVGGTAPYIYTLVDNLGGGAAINHPEPAGANYCFPNVDFGDYTVIVTDANGCTVVKANLIMSNPPNDLTFVIAGSVPNCAAGATVDVTLVGAIGVGPFEFGIVDQNIPNWSTNFNSATTPPYTYQFTGLTPGAIYTIVVRDITTGCYYFEQMPAPTATNSTMTVNSLTPHNVTCKGLGDGSVSFGLSGIDPSTTSISYTIHYSANNLLVPGASNSGTLLPPFTFPPLATIGGNLLPGNYYIQFIELGPGAVSGCGVASAPFAITESGLALSLTATTTNDNCAVNAGQIAPVASGGTAPYLYQYGPTGFVPGPWVGPVVNPFHGESGNYDVVVMDANGCIVRIPVTIGLDPTPVIAASVANACAAQGAFAINVTLPTAGIAPYTVSVDSGAYQAQTFPYSITGLSSGAHTVQVKDVNGCGNLVNVNILTPLVVSATFTTMPTCLNSDGTITAVASGGSGNYTYTLLSTVPAIIAGPQASAVFPNQPAGSYIIRVTDTTTGCSTDTPFNIPLPTPVTYTTATTAVSCSGLSDGTITINLSAGNNNPPYTYQILVPPVGPQSSNVFTGLPAGNYSVQVNSGSGCSVVTNNVIVGSPSVVVATTTATPFTCAANNSVNTSTVTITGAGGTPAYSYSIDGVNYFPTNTFTVSTAGSITGYVKDSHGCIDTDVFVLAPLPALVSATVTQNTAITCNNPEMVTITVVGGSGNFTYQALPIGVPNVTQVGAPNQFNISAPGTYFFQVNDVTTGCYIATLGYTVAPFNTINVVATATKPVTCFGGNDGALTINVSGYSGAYTYSVLDNTNTSVLAGAGNTSTNPLTIAGLPGGSYTVQVTETASPFCVKVSNVVTIASPSAALIVDAVETANVTCSNNKGVISATATGGWGTYTYSIAPVAGVQLTPGVFSSLPAGNYTITVTDLLTCSTTDNVILVLPAPINANVTANAASVSCFGDETGTITISYPTGGQGSNYSYVLTTNSPASASGPIAIPLGGVVVSGLGADTYTITITDGYGCQFGPVNIVIAQPTEVEASLVIATTQTCLNNTTLTLTGTGGTQPYTYSANAAGPYVPFVPAAATSTTITVPVGTYSYYIKDANGCISNISNGITIVPLTPLVFTSLTNTNILCGGSNSGTITAAANGGLSNYVYTLLDGAGNPIAPVPTQLMPGHFTNLAPGTYQVRVTSGDCILTSPNVVITAPPTLVINAVGTSAKCKGDNSGFITLTITGGTGTIQYAISPNLSQFITIPNPAGGYIITGLAAGTYTVIVQDQNGCTPMPPLSVVVGEPALALSGAITAFADETCAELNDGTLTIANLAGGTAPYTVNYSVIYPDNTTVTGTPVALPLGTTTYTFTNLNGGIYTALITDANGCKFDQEQVVGSGVLYDPYAQVSFPCDNNAPAVRVEVVNLSNPPSLAFVPAADFLFSLDVNNIGSAQASPIFTSATHPSLLVPGNHIIYVFSANGCNKQTQQFTINAADIDPLTLVLSQGGLNTILATAGGGSGGYSYTYNGGSPTTSNTYVYQQSGLYTVVVTDSSGCTATASKYFEFIPIFIPNVFTPNGDGHNPMWGPTNTGNYKDLVTKVYDRYGRVVAELAEGQFWDGKYNNQELPSGDYWYVIKVDGNNDSEYVGHFTLYR